MSIPAGGAAAPAAAAAAPAAAAAAPAAKKGKSCERFYGRMDINVLSCVLPLQRRRRRKRRMMTTTWASDSSNKVMLCICVFFTNTMTFQ